MLKLVKTSRNAAGHISTGILLDRFNPIIYVQGPINEKMAEDFIRALNEIENTRNTEAVLVKIDTPGGEVFQGFKMINAMKSSRLSVATQCIGTAYSMGAVLVSAGQKGMRFASPLSHYMIHSVASGAVGRIEEMRTEMKCKMKCTESINTMLFRELARNCGRTVKQIEDAIKATGFTEFYLDPWEAKRFGLVDHVADVGMAKQESYQLDIDFIPDPNEPEKKKKSSKNKDDKVEEEKKPETQEETKPPAKTRKKESPKEETKPEEPVKKRTGKITRG